MSWMIGVVALVLCLAQYGAAQAATGEAAPAPARASLRSAYEELAKALGKNDATRLEALIADDFMLIDFEGKTSTKKSLLDAVREGIITLQKLETKGPRYLEFTGGGMVQGAVVVEMGYGQGAQRQVGGLFAVTCVFALRENAWMLAGAQMTRIPPKQTP